MTFSCKPFLLPVLLPLGAGPSASAMPPRAAPLLTATDLGLVTQDLRLAATAAVGEDLERERAQGARLHKRIGILLALQTKMTEAQYAEAFAKIVEEGDRQRQAYAGMERTMKDFTAHTLGRVGGATHGPRSPQKVRQLAGCFAAVTRLVVPLKRAQEELETALLSLRPGHEARGLAWPWPEPAKPGHGRRSAAVMPAPDRSTRRLLEAANQDLDALEAKQAQAQEQARLVAQVKDEQRLHEVAQQEAMAAAKAGHAAHLAEKELERERWRLERQALAAQLPEPGQPEPSPEALAEQLRTRKLLEEAAEDRQREREREEQQERQAQLEALRCLAAEAKANLASLPAPAPAPAAIEATEQPTFTFRWHPAALDAFEALDPHAQVAILTVMDKVGRGVGKGTNKHSKRLLGSGEALFELRPQGGQSPYRPIFTVGAAPRTYVLLAVGNKASFDQDLATAAERAIGLD